MVAVRSQDVALSIVHLAADWRASSSMMGTNGGNIGGGPGGNELGGMMASGNTGSGHPPATEYTLQGK